MHFVFDLEENCLQCKHIVAASNTTMAPIMDISIAVATTPTLVALVRMSHTLVLDCSLFLRRASVPMSSSSRLFCSNSSSNDSVAVVDTFTAGDTDVSGVDVKSVGLGVSAKKNDTYWVVYKMV